MVERGINSNQTCCNEAGQQLCQNCYSPMLCKNIEIHGAPDFCILVCPLPTWACSTILNLRKAAFRAEKENAMLKKEKEELLRCANERYATRFFNQKYVELEQRFKELLDSVNSVLREAASLSPEQIGTVAEIWIDRLENASSF